MFWPFRFPYKEEQLQTLEPLDCRHGCGSQDLLNLLLSKLSVLLWLGCLAAAWAAVPTWSFPPNLPRWMPVARTADTNGAPNCGPLSSCSIFGKKKMFSCRVAYIQGEKLLWWPFGRHCFQSMIYTTQQIHNQRRRCSDVLLTLLLSLFFLGNLHKYSSNIANRYCTYHYWVLYLETRFAAMTGASTKLLLYSCLSHLTHLISSWVEIKRLEKW